MGEDPAVPPFLSQPNFFVLRKSAKRFYEQSFLFG